jgi:hypothetical protein
MKEKQDPAEVLANFLCSHIDLMGTGFMFRSKDYDDLGGIPHYPSLLFADFELWINLARKSFMVVAEQESFAFRMHQSTTASSADAVFLKAFDQCVSFLEKLKTEDAELANVIEKNAAAFLNFYCQGLTSRILRTAMKKRNGQTVAGIINNFNDCAQRLLPGNNYQPLNNFTVRMALYIDSNFIARNLFLLFKKIYSKPIADNKI